VFSLGLKLILKNEDRVKSSYAHNQSDLSSSFFCLFGF
jgi:hypothetical protein